MNQPHPGPVDLPTFVRSTRDTLQHLPAACRDDAARITALRALEDLKAAVSAAQARLAVAFAASQRAMLAEADEPAHRQGVDVSAQVALARRESPYQGGRLLGMARALVVEMPHTLAALEAGAINEYRAMLLVKETACLSVEDRASVDAEVCGDLAGLDGVGTRQLVAAAKRAACRLDPAALVARADQAVASRCVTIRPAPDSMTYLTALLPLAAGVACYQALRGAAASATATGDSRGRGQIMADTLVQRLTGQADANRVNVGVHLIMTDQGLLGGSSEPAYLHGLGPIPAASARRMITQSGTESWLRRLYTRPESGELVATDSRSRRFPAGLAQLIQLRDQSCRTPWCDAPIRHLDHVIPFHAGGPTSLTNGQGLCEACNHTKQAPGWQQIQDAATGAVQTQTPTGHRYLSRPPPPPGQASESGPALARAG